MAEKVAFELVSPERLLASLEADMVVVPGEEGHFGVLPGHAPLMSLIRPGVIDVHDGGQISQRIFVEGGFAEVNPDGLIVLAEAATPVEELTREGATQALSNAEDDLRDAGAVDEDARQKLERAVNVAKARLDAVS